MKVTKDVLQSQEEKRSIKDLFKREPKEKPYNGKVDLQVSQQEYEIIVQASRIHGGYKPFVVKAIEEFESLEELKVPKTEEQAKTWFTFDYEKPFKESLEQKAKTCGLSLEEFVRAVVWTRAKVELQKQKERDEQRFKNHRVSRGFTLQLGLRGEFLKRFEAKYGEMKSQEEAFNKVLEIINKDLN